MRSREGARRPCLYCRAATVFEREVIGPRGKHIRWEDCCQDCGERPARRTAKQQKEPA